MSNIELLRILRISALCIGALSKGLPTQCHAASALPGGRTRGVSASSPAPEVSEPALVDLCEPTKQTEEGEDPPTVTFCHVRTKPLTVSDLSSCPTLRSRNPSASTFASPS